jgi:hypothetical protein
MHLDTLLFILLIAVAAMLRWLASKAGETKRRPYKPDPRSTSTPQMGNPPRRAPAESDQERIRRFLEALGQPTTSRPPPPVARRPTYEEPLALPHPPPLKSPLPPLTTRPPELSKKIPIPRQTNLPPDAELKFEVQHGGAPSEPGHSSVAVPAEAKSVNAPASERTISSDKIEILLRSGSGLRNAIVLREILGPPRGLQVLDAKL